MYADQSPGSTWNKVASRGCYNLAIHYRQTGAPRGAPGFAAPETA